MEPTVTRLRASSIEHTSIELRTFIDLILQVAGLSNFRVRRTGAQGYELGRLLNPLNPLRFKVLQDRSGISSRRSAAIRPFEFQRESARAFFLCASARKSTELLPHRYCTWIRACWKSIQ